jgi:hypothetical protein
VRADSIRPNVIRVLVLSTPPAWLWQHFAALSGTQWLFSMSSSDVLLSSRPAPLPSNSAPVEIPRPMSRAGAGNCLLTLDAASSSQAVDFIPISAACSFDVHQCTVYTRRILDHGTHSFTCGSLVARWDNVSGSAAVPGQHLWWQAVDVVWSEVSWEIRNSVGPCRVTPRQRGGAPPSGDRRGSRRTQLWQACRCRPRHRSLRARAGGCRRPGPGRCVDTL